ncbi:leucine-rich repeat-containing protein 63 isoform X2 [Macrotis lagotis]|uniref:leucine-rich repeat-containing protein 63 isoform X2 n=1 Tax=Macrotis lagotis TaxID=92651 RepID=UPI003D688901
MLTLPKLLRKPLPPKTQPKPLQLKKESPEPAITDATINQQSKRQDLHKPHPSRLFPIELEKILIPRKFPKRRRQSRIHIKNLLLKCHLKRYRDTAPKMFLRKYTKFYMLFSNIKEDYGGPFYMPTRHLIRHDSASEKSNEQWISSETLTPLRSSSFIKHDLEHATPDSDYESLIYSSKYMDNSMYKKGKMDWYERLRTPQNTISNKIFSFDELSATLPRRPYTNTILEMSQNKRKKSKLKKSISSENISSFTEIIPEKSESEEEFIVCGEGYCKKPLSLSDKEKMNLARIAVKRCHDYSKNALSLKGFFIERCPNFGILAYQLVYLNLAFNSLSIFPTEVFVLKNLQVLIMRNNPIKEIPSEIEELKYLTIFIISFNLLTSLPKGIFSLSKLEFLDVSYNEITSIPKDIQNLSSKLCDYCQGPMYGKGLHLIRPYNVFNYPLLPILVKVCSPRCYKMASSAPEFLTR